LNPRSLASRQPIIRPGERSSPTPEATSRRATEWAVLAPSVDIRPSDPPVRATVTWWLLGMRHGTHTLSLAGTGPRS
jgi:hypothetical protein